MHVMGNLGFITAENQFTTGFLFLGPALQRLVCWCDYEVTVLSG